MSPNQLRRDEELVEQVRDVLDAQTLTPELVERLRSARRNAVAEVVSKPSRLPAAWLPVALAATLLAVVLLRPSMDPGAAPPLDVDVQLAAADLELLENLEFAAWMVESDGTDAG